MPAQPAGGAAVVGNARYHTEVRVTVRERIVVVGGGVGGLAPALTLGRAGHEVTLLERDPLPAWADAEEAFAAERRGAPQVHQTHGFLARIVVELREHFPDVLDELLAAGGHVHADDRRARRAAAGRRGPQGAHRAAHHVRVGAAAGGPGPARCPLPHRAAVDRARGARTAIGPPVVAGVRLDDGTRLEADAVVAATGWRGAVPGWLGALGVDVPETVHESGLCTCTRWYRLPEAFTAGSTRSSAATSAS